MGDITQYYCASCSTSAIVHKLSLFWIVVVEVINTVVSFLNGIIWNYLLIYLLICVGLWFSFRLKFIQLTDFTHMAKLITKSRTQSKHAISSFQALCTTLAARVGTGNITGVAVAISLGGAGAIFWMWLIALLGMATAFAESLLAQLYKEKQKDGTFKGGPAYYMTNGAKKPWLAVIYSSCLFFGYGFVFSTVQINTITEASANAYGFNPLVVGIIITLLAAIIVLGGLKQIAKIAELVVPFMALAYLSVTLYVIANNFSALPSVITQIFSQAFSWQEAGAGLFGAAMVQGIKRGLYSNEAGTGSAPNAAAAAEAVPHHPASQGYVQMFGVVVDTLVVCSCTAFLLLLSGAGQAEQMEGISLTQQALVTQVGPWGKDFLTIIIFFFCFTSIIANYAYAEMNLTFVGLENTLGRLFFNCCFLGMLVYGAIATLPQVIAMADLAFGLMALVNIAALFLLSKTVREITKDYQAQRKQGHTITYQPSDKTVSRLNIDSSVWSPKITEKE